LVRDASGEHCVPSVVDTVPDRHRRIHQGRLAIDVDGRIRSARVIEVLSRW